jgi:hypothetical protein
MALTRFRVRSPGRDRETDFSRLQRLHQLLADIRREMERERSGLRERYEKLTANAAFSLLAMEGDSGGASISPKVGEMTDAMVRHARRIASLEGQIGFVTDIDQQVELFSRENAGG